MSMSVMVKNPSSFPLLIVYTMVLSTVLSSLSVANTLPTSLPSSALSPTLNVYVDLPKVGGFEFVVSSKINKKEFLTMFFFSEHSEAEDRAEVTGALFYGVQTV